ncbi:MAG TPA: prepilin-type N-terminal cleavage/methylation domain-containing protein [Candidatus Limnocylindrales bacterium]|nr:prepilin-type N-terminal cleavage/methylation domain-containing protein [Candidatus Limnocylindrales bacterium]
MLQRLRAARQNQNGFTLTELLIVVVILGVLAAIVVFAVAGITDRGVDAACDADKRTVQTAVEAYHAQNNSYPSGGTPATRIQTLITAKLLREPPSTAKYTVTLGDGDGLVTATINSGGAAC